MRLVEGKRQPDGRWLLARYDDALGIPFGETTGEPSRWNTLRALRVLRWYEEAGASPVKVAFPCGDQGIGEAGA